MLDTETTAVAQRGLAGITVDRARGAIDQATLRTESAADMNAELAEIGLSEKTGWYAAILMYGIGGFVTVIAGVLWPDTVPLGVTLLGCLAIVFSGLSVLGLRYLVNADHNLVSADWATHLRLGGGLMIFLIGAFVAGDLRQAFVLMPMFVLITPTFIYGRRFAAPYTIVVTTAMFVILMATPGPARVAHAIVTTGAILMIVISFMFAEQTTRRLARANRTLAYTDPLTGIANTRRLRERLTEALGKPLSDGQPFALFAIDLDNFKLVNDTFDHSTGDRVLKSVANALAQEVRAEDLVARRGGDEFSVLVSNPDPSFLNEMTLRLEAAIERARSATCPQITPTGSVAWVESKPSDTIASVLQRADDELHAKKLAFHSANGTRDETAKATHAAVQAGADMTRITDRDEAMRSVAAAVNKAFARPSTPARAKLRRFAERVRHELLALNAMWAYAGIEACLGGLLIAILTLSGLVAPLPLAAGLASGGLLTAVGLFCIWAAKADLSVKYLPIGFAVAIGSVTLALANAGQSGAALIDIYAVIALYAFYFMRPRAALVVLAACSALYIGFAVGASYPAGGLRAGVSVPVLIVCAAILIKVRSVTLNFVRKNQELSEVDALTGVANLRALRLRVARALESADPKDLNRRPILVTIDLDCFKEVNDSYNHTVGDQVLESVARAISETVRVDELVARRGGDEFFILFANETDEHIMHIIPRLRDAVEYARLRICPDLVPTASVGHVGWMPGQDVDAFMLSADGVMHDEKVETRQRDYGRMHA